MNIPILPPSSLLLPSFALPPSSLPTSLLPSPSLLLPFSSSLSPLLLPSLPPPSLLPSPSLLLPFSFPSPSLLLPPSLPPPFSFPSPSLLLPPSLLPSPFSFPSSPPSLPPYFYLPLYLKCYLFLFCRTKEKLSDMQEVSSVMKESVWMDDKNITECQQCNKPFSVARRKVREFGFRVCCLL